MAYFTKEQYEAKRMWAERRNAANSVIARDNGLSEEQTDALEELCRFRHNMHCNAADQLYCSEAPDYDTYSLELSDVRYGGIRERIEALFGVAPFERCEFLGDDDYYDGNAREDYPEVFADCDEDEMSDAWYNYCYDHNCEQVSSINSQIESFLLSIDEQCGTSYCPTGFARMN